MTCWTRGRMEQGVPEQLSLDGTGVKQVTVLGKDEARMARIRTGIDTAWLEFQEAYAGLSDEDLLIPGVTGAWSIRDLIAHVTWWDEESIRHLPEIREGIRPARYSVVYGGLDAFNALMTERKASLSLAEVRAEFVETHQRLLEYLDSVPIAEILGNDKFKRRLKLDTYGHYPIHTADILRWREAQGR